MSVAVFDRADSLRVMKLSRLGATLGIVLLVSGCVSTDDSGPESEIRRLNATDATKAVTTRTMLGNWRFLAWAGEGPNSIYVPGLTKEEMHEYIESGHFGYEVYYFYDLGPIKPSREHEELRTAKLHYTERMNRALVEAIRQREHR